MSRAYDNRTLVALMARRSSIVKQLSELSRDGWAGARFEDYAPLEQELRALDARRAELEDRRCS